MIFGGAYGADASAITREFYFNIGSERAAIYLFLFLSVGSFAWSLYRRVKTWRRGKPELRTDRPARRVLAVMKYAVLQAKVLREKTAGAMHGALFFGFMGLVLTTAILTLQEDIFQPILGVRFLSGDPYLLWSLFGELMGLLVLAGLLGSIVRRYLLRPSRLDNKSADTFILALLSLVIITGFLAEALRIALAGYPRFEQWSFAGYHLGLLFSGADPDTLRTLHYADWWVHMAGSFLFIALLGVGKIGHAVIATLNIYFMKLENESTGAKYSINTIEPNEFETAETFGVAKIEEFTWKQLLDLDACTRCGRCQDACPAHLTEKPLSPKKFINDLKGSMDNGAKEQAPLIGGSVMPDEFWSCTNCGACMEACPVNIEHVQKMIDLRRQRVLMEGDMAPELQTTFQNLEMNFNPYGFAYADRGAWRAAAAAEGLDLPLLSENPDVDYLYFTGSAASYDKRNQKVALAFLKIMKAAGISVGVLGPEEADSGDAALRGGNEYLFQALAARNLERFNHYGVKRIVCTCPHDFNVIKKEYRQFARAGAGPNGEALSCDFQVFHHTQVIAELLRKGAITPAKTLNDTVTYHDSCFLGRYNGIYGEPRFILNAIPGLTVTEMGRNRRGSLCCGAGGARMFIEEHLGSRINQLRTREAADTGAARVCTACPFCMTMLSDGRPSWALTH